MGRTNKSQDFYDKHIEKIIELAPTLTALEISRVLGICDVQVRRLKNLHKTLTGTTITFYKKPNVGKKIERVQNFNPIMIKKWDKHLKLI